jgi:hypothetical protein
MLTPVLAITLDQHIRYILVFISMVPCQPVSRVSSRPINHQESLQVDRRPNRLLNHRCSQQFHRVVNLPVIPLDNLVFSPAIVLLDNRVSYLLVNLH